MVQNVEYVLNIKQRFFSTLIAHYVFFHKTLMLKKIAFYEAVAAGLFLPGAQSPALTDDEWNVCYNFLFSTKKQETWLLWIHFCTHKTVNCLEQQTLYMLRTHNKGCLNNNKQQTKTYNKHTVIYCVQWSDRNGAHFPVKSRLHSFALTPRGPSPVDWSKHSPRVITEAAKKKWKDQVVQTAVPTPPPPPPLVVTTTGFLTSPPTSSTVPCCFLSLSLPWLSPPSPLHTSSILRTDPNFFSNDWPHFFNDWPIFFPKQIMKEGGGGGHWQ